MLLDCLGDSTRSISGGVKHRSFHQKGKGVETRQRSTELFQSDFICSDPAQGVGSALGGRPVICAVCFNGCAQVITLCQGNAAGVSDKSLARCAPKMHHWCHCGHDTSRRMLWKLSSRRAVKAPPDERERSHPRPDPQYTRGSFLSDAACIGHWKQK